MITYCDPPLPVETVTFDGRAMSWEFKGVEDGQILLWAPLQGDYLAELSHGRLLKTKNWWVDAEDMKKIRRWCDDHEIPYDVRQVPRPIEEVFSSRRARAKKQDPRQMRLFDD